MKPRLRHAAVALLLTALHATGLAHKASDAYLSWQVDGAVVEQRVDIALRDLDRELALDADDDGQLTWGEVRRRADAIAQLADAAVTVRADGADCTVQASRPLQLEEHVDGRYAVLQRTLRCGMPVRTIEIDYRLFAASDATHRGIARARAGTQDRQAVLVPGAGVQRMALHGVDDGGQGFLGFVAEGMHHIAIGLDHILFLVTLLMVAVWRRDGAGWVPRASARSAWLETLRLVTAFTLAHSVTLGLAAAGVLAPPTRGVETLIAASVAVAALDNVRPFVPGPRWIMASLFGLVHGFGFAGPLQDLGLQGRELVQPLLGFNLGVELGQLALVALLLPLACLLRSLPAYRWGVVRGGSFAIGLLAMAWTLERGLDLKLLS